MSDVSAWAQSVADAVAQTVCDRYCHPAATYRLQFEPGVLTFRDAAALTPYLDELGISHVYASPYLKARSGSKHGYAIVDYGQLNPELGSDDDYRAMIEALRARGMGQILDTVPNHMSAVPAENLWWNDVLENGPGSPHAAYFDIDWRPVKEELRDRILLPILGGQYGQVLESGELKLEYRDGAFFLRYYQWLLPLDPRTYRTVLTHGLDGLKAALPADSEDLRELESVVTALEHLPERTATEPGLVAERQREKEVIKGRLRKLAEQSPAVAGSIARGVQELNGTPADPHSLDTLDKLADAQVYRLSHWKAADDEINYRRFFDINELAAVCTEDPAVFAEGHRLIFELLVRGDVDGLRVDHIDGLYDPVEYLRRLQGGYLRALGSALYQGTGSSGRRIAGGAQRSTGGGEGPEIPHLSALIPHLSSLVPHLSLFASPPHAGVLATAEAAGGPEAAEAPPWSEVEPVYLPMAAARTCTDRTRLPLYVVTEKILVGDETLSDQWLLAGTTGYEFLNSVGGLFVDPSGLAELAKIYARFIDGRPDFHDVAHQSRLLILRTAMSSDLQLLAHRLNRISEQHRRSRDFTLNTLRVALREIIACFPVYRTYIRGGYVSERDRQIVCRAVAQAKRRNPVINAAVFDFIREVLLLEHPPEVDESGRRQRELFIGRFQQATSPVMAKGIEDTACYRCFPLASLSEVGGDPGRGATAIDEFHRQNAARQAQWPRSLLCSTTHDTKRSEDVRARISVLSEVPHLWRKAVNRWARLNRRHRREVDGQPAPSRNDEYLFYQTLVGVWPPSPPRNGEIGELADRLRTYMEKATREAKVHTSWINPDAEYDAAVREFVTEALDDRPKNRFLADFRRFHEGVVNWGLYSALVQTLLKLTCPGVPDIYQGQELWDFSLVDPDNRRPVDLCRPLKMLARLKREIGRRDRSLLAAARRLAHDPRDPCIKLFVTWRTLQFRRQHAELFRAGDYIPLTAEGPRANHVCAFARRLPPSSGSDGQIAVVVVPRWIAQLTPLLPEGTIPQPPLGPAVWQDTQVMLGELAARPLTSLFTGQVSAADGSPLRVADALSDFPVAVLSDVL